jgi:Ca-activated chloride channel family protein
MNKNTNSLQIDTDQSLIPIDVSAQRILEIHLQAPVAVNALDRPRLNLALVLDRSGSMGGDKLSYVKQAATHVLNLLQEQDRIALITYDDKIDVLSASTGVSDTNRRELIRKIARLETGGSTNLSGGWLAGCQEAAAVAEKETINRALLLTDGEANAGIIDPEELARHAKELSNRGISTSTFGVGAGFNEHLLEAMANQGGGNFYFIDQPGSIPALFLREFKELAAVTARNVEITLDFPANWRLQVPGGWRTEFSEGRLRIFLGNLFSGQKQDIYIKLAIPATGEPANTTLKINLSGKDEKDFLFEETAGLAFQYADQAQVEAAPQNHEIVERFALVYLAEIATRALILERKGEREKASQLLSQVIEQYRKFISPDELDKFQRMAERMKHGMDEIDRKQSHYASYNQKRGKLQ